VKTVDEPQQSLKDAVEQWMAEARMVLPGIQALLGFQLIAVFNSRFTTALSSDQQHLHLAAIRCVALAIALIMTPAAFHRQTDPGRVTPRLLRVSTVLVNLALAPLALGLSIDVYLVGFAITERHGVSLAIASAVAGTLVGLWYVFPSLNRPRRRRREDDVRGTGNAKT